MPKRVSIFYNPRDKKKNDERAEQLQEVSDKGIYKKGLAALDQRVETKKNLMSLGDSHAAYSDDEELQRKAKRARTPEMRKGKR